MPHSIIKLPSGKYGLWNTGAAKPASLAMDRREFVSFYTHMYGSEHVHQKLEQADATGCSVEGVSFDDCVLSNRAGSNLECLPKDQLLALFQPQEDAYIPYWSEW